MATASSGGRSARELEEVVVDFVRKVAVAEEDGEQPEATQTITPTTTEAECSRSAGAAQRLLSMPGRGVGIWDALAAEGVKPAVVARGLSRALSLGPGGRARLELSRFYAALLALEGSPALGLFDEIAWSCAVASARTHFAADESSKLVLENLTAAVTGRLNLNAFDGTVTTTVETLAPLTREIRCKSVSDDGQIEVEVTALWTESLRALYALLRGLVVAEGGEARKSGCVALMRSMQPVLALEVSNRKAPNKVKQWLNAEALEFLRDFARPRPGDEEGAAGKSVGALARHCCIKAPSAAEARSHASHSVASLVGSLAGALRSEFMAFLCKLLRHPQVNQRAFALEVCQNLVEGCFGTTGGSPKQLDWEALLSGVLDRAVDKAGSIRVRAINCLSSVVSRAQQGEGEGGRAVREALKGSLGHRTADLAGSRLRDSKPTVRKAALGLLACVLPLVGDLSEASVRAISAASRDAFVSVRKQAAASASSIYASFGASDLSCRLWLQVVLPLCLDAETSIQTKCRDSLLREFLGAVSSGTGGAFLALLDREPNFAVLLRRVMGTTKLTHSQLSRAAKVLQEGIKRLRSPREEAGFWVFLSEVVAKYPSLLRAEFARDKLEGLREYMAAPKTFVRVVQTLGSAAARIGENFAREACELLAGELGAFSVPVDAISQCLRTLSRLSAALDPEAADGTSGHLSGIAAKAESFFKESMGRKTLDDLETKLASAIYTMGELSLLRSFAVSEGVVVLVQGMTSDCLLGSDVVIPKAILAHSWTCLGKFCLQDEDLAKRFIPLFFHEIKSTEVSAVRNNIMLILADLCTKYTNLVDVHIGEIAKCFDDPSEMVRRQTLIVLASLLQQDFLKWRGPIFHCFLLSLVDESASVRSLGNFLLSTSLSHKASLLAYNFFVQTLFALNGHNGYANLSMSLESQALVATSIRDLAGSDEGNRQKRCVVYHHLLKRMTPEHKFQIAAKICEDCVGGFVEGKLCFDAQGEILRDSLLVLASREIKAEVSCAREDEEDGRRQALARAKGKLISAMMKKHLVGTIIPLVVELKQIFEKRRSPLLGILMGFACAVLREHREEVEEILVADHTFAREVLYEMQQEGRSRQPLVRPEGELEDPSLGSPILRGNSFSTPTAAPGSRSPLPVGTTSKTPLAAEVLQEEGMATARGVRANSEKKYLDSVARLRRAREEGGEENAASPRQKVAQSNEVRRLSSLFNAAAD